MNIVKKGVLVLLLVAILTGCGDNKTKDSGKSVTIDFAAVKENPSDYKKYEGKTVTITNVPIWKSSSSLSGDTLGNLVFSISCGNKDDLDLASFEDGAKVTVSGELTLMSSLGPSISKCTVK